MRQWYDLKLLVKVHMLIHVQHAVAQLIKYKKGVTSNAYEPVSALLQNI